MGASKKKSKRIHSLLDGDDGIHNLVVRMSTSYVNRLKEVAEAESYSTARIVSVQELVRQCIAFTLFEGERLRDCFRRKRLVKKQ